MMRALITALYFLQAGMFVVLDRLADQNLTSYGLLFRGLIWSLVLFNVVTGLRALHMTWERGNG